MKKLNENALRQLILETIEEALLPEGKRKKIKEDEAVPQPSVDTSGDRPPAGMSNPDFDMSDAEAAGMMSSFSDEQVKQAHEALDKAFELAKAANQNPMLKGSAEDMLKGIMNLFKGETK